MKKTMKRFIAIVMTIAMIMMVKIPDVSAATKITVTYKQTTARSMYAMVNSFRTGSQAYYVGENGGTVSMVGKLSKLTYDYELEKVAMQRAAEIAVNFDHYRPNGSLCFTAYPSSYDYSAKGENIYYEYGNGAPDASSAFSAWKEDGESYNGQGHRRNMLSNNFTSIGIGCCVYNGYTFWVQEFSSKVVNPTATAANNSSTSVDVSGNVNTYPSLNTPALVSASNVTSGINVTWKKVADAQGYYVFRKVAGGNWENIQKITSGSTVSYVDTTAKAGTTYTYTVRAYKVENGSQLLSGFSSTGISCKRLVNPTLVSAINCSGGVKLTWKAVSGATGYYVYRKVTGGSWARIGTVTSGSTVSYADKTAASGTTYIYTVRAYNGSMLSSFNATGVSTYFLKTPTVKAVASTGYVTVTWNKIAGCTGYYVYRKTASGSYARIGTITSASTVKFVDKTAKKGTTYYYTVRAYKGSVMSSYVAAPAVKAK